MNGAVGTAEDRLISAKVRAGAETETYRRHLRRRRRAR